MRYNTFLVILSLLFCLSCATQVTPQEKRDLIVGIRSRYPDLSRDEVKRMATLILDERAHETDSIQADPEDPFPKFNCPIFNSDTVPTSADKVKIPDINIVGALGDSITAGFGALASTIFGIFTEYRGISWSIGGNGDKKDPWGQKLYTMANILKYYNPEVKGYSTSTGGADSGAANLNVAVSGAIAQDIPGQAQKLVERVQSKYGDAAYTNDWKLITLWIGGNDLCAVCKGDPKHSPERYTEYIIQGLRTLKTMPRTIVNLAYAIDVTELYPLSSGFCSLLHGFECKCGTGSASQRQFTSETQKEYNRMLASVPTMAEFNDKDDFVVIGQPLYKNVTIPLTADGKPDKLYFAPDCFHFSGVGQEAAGIGLWNNLIEKVGEKRVSWKPKDPIECPKETDYIWSHRNSN